MESNTIIFRAMMSAGLIFFVASVMTAIYKISNNEPYLLSIIFLYISISICCTEIVYLCICECIKMKRENEARNRYFVEYRDTLLEIES